MLTKERRDEMRRLLSEAAMLIRGDLTDEQRDRAIAAKMRIDTDGFAEIAVYLDALDEMERERDALPSHAQVEAAFQTGKVFGRQEDEREIAAQRNELAGVLRSLMIRHRNEDGTKRTADEMWAELKERAIDQEHEGRDGWDD